MRCQLRYAAGLHWLIDMEQQGETYHKPIPLNEVGAEIWTCHARGMDENQIVSFLMSEYEAEESAIRTDVEQFLEQIGRFWQE